MDGASSTTVGIIMMQEWCAKVGRCVYMVYMCVDVPGTCEIMKQYHTNLGLKFLHVHVCTLYSTYIDS